MMRHSVNARWRSIAAPLVVLRVLGQGTEFVAFLVFARHLGAPAFGRLAVVYIVCRYGALVADWGANLRGVRDLADDRGIVVLRGLLRRRVEVSIALSALFVAATVALHHPAEAPMAALILWGGLSRDWVALGREQGTRAAFPSLVRGLLMLGGSFAVTTEAGAAVVLGLGAVIGVVCSVALNTVPADDGSGTDHRPDAWILVAVFMTQISTSIDTILLSVLRSNREAGIYAAVYRIPVAWLTVTALLIMASLPITTRSLRVAPERLRELIARCARAGSVAVLVLLFIAPGLVVAVPTLFGNAYRSGQGPLAVLLVATAISTMSGILSALQIAIGSDRAYGLILSAGAILNVAVNLVVIPTFGMIGAAWTTAGSETFVAVLIAISLRRAVKRAAI